MKTYNLLKVGDKVKLIDIEELSSDCIKRINTMAIVLGKNYYRPLIEVRFVSDNYTGEFFAYRFELQPNDPEKICKLNSK